MAYSTHANVVSQLSAYYKLYIDLSNCYVIIILHFLNLIGVRGLPNSHQEKCT